MPNLSLTPLYASPVPVCCVFIFPGIRVLVGAAVNHLNSIISVVKLASVISEVVFSPCLAVFAERLRSPLPLPAV